MQLSDSAMREVKILTLLLSLLLMLLLLLMIRSVEHRFTPTRRVDFFAGIT